jgi:hypothetical protein
MSDEHEKKEPPEPEKEELPEPEKEELSDEPENKGPSDEHDKKEPYELPAAKNIRDAGRLAAAVFAHIQHHHGREKARAIFARCARSRDRLTDEAVSALIALLRGERRKHSAEKDDGERAFFWCIEHWDSVDLGTKVWIRNMLDPAIRDSVPARFEIVPNPAGVNYAREIEIARYVDEQIKARPNSKRKMSIYIDAKNKFDLSVSQVEKIVARWKPIVDMLNQRAIRAARKK